MKPEREDDSGTTTTAKTLAVMDPCALIGSRLGAREGLAESVPRPTRFAILTICYNSKMSWLLRVRDVVEKLDVHELTVRRWIAVRSFFSFALSNTPP